MDITTYALAKKQAVKEVPSLVDDWLEENIDPASDYALDRTLTLENAAAPADMVGDLKSATNHAINGIADFEQANILYGLPVYDRTFINDSTGAESTNGSFYSYKGAVIPEGTTRLYPFNDYSDSNKYIRSIVFRDANGDYISGISGAGYNVTDGVAVPPTAKTCDASLTYATGSAYGTHFLSTNPVGNKEAVSINDDVSVPIAPVFGFNNTLNIRMPVINFQFDDGNAKDDLIVEIFDDYSMKCGFALLSTVNDENTRRYLLHQNNGYEIMSHSTDGTGMDDATVSSDTIETKLKNSLSTLKGKGFNIKGFVTPNSAMNAKFKPLLRKYYQWADTVFLGEYTGTGKPYDDPQIGVYNLKRVSLQTTTLANQKSAVDACIDNYGCLTFYGHAAALDTTDYLTTQNLEALLTYIADKVSNGKCLVLAPSEAIQNYFEARNDDAIPAWIDVPVGDVNLDNRFKSTAWKMSYSSNLKLLYFACRIESKEAVSGQINPLFTFPQKTFDNLLIQSDTGRNCLVYSNGLLIQGSNTWASGTNYRFSGLFMIE